MARYMMGKLRFLSIKMFLSLGLVSILIPSPFGAQEPSLLVEDFTDGDFVGWTVVDEGTHGTPSAWSASTGALRETGNIHDNHVAQVQRLGTYAYYAAGTDWTDYTATLTLQSDDNDSIGVMVRFKDPLNYYRFAWNQERSQRRLVKRVNGNFNVLAQDTVPYVSGQAYQVEMRAQGTQLQVLIDGTLIFDVTDTSVPNGTVGLYSYANASSEFDDIVVTDLNGPHPPNASWRQLQAAVSSPVVPRALPAWAPFPAPPAGPTSRKTRW